MSITEIKLEYSECKNSTENAIPVIIAAAGNSERMNGINKQFSLICGVPVLARTLQAFENSKSISKIIIVAREGDFQYIQLLAEKYMITKLSDITVGGSNRQESVKNGLLRLDKKETKVLIHDGARPLVNDRIISAVAKKLESCNAVTCAVKVKDTIKQVSDNGKVIKTLDRNSLVAVQTPQGVNISAYKSALEKAGTLKNFTDDMSIMESAGYDVAVVEGSYKNIKITTPEDITAAEGIINGEEEL